MGNRPFAPALAALFALVLSACSTPGSTAGPSSSPTPTSSPAPTPTGQPTSTHSPTASASGSSARPTDGYVGAGVASPAQAAAIVFLSNPLFAEILPQSPSAVGQSAWYSATEDGPGYAVSVSLGSGDCLSGCTHTHTWNYSVSHDGNVTLKSEQGDTVEVSTPTPSDQPATITIHTVAGPVCPVERNPPDPSCAPRPIPGTKLVVRAPTGEEVAEGVTDASGAATFTLPGGAYYVEAATVSGVMGQAQPAAFAVVSGSTIGFPIEYDTGIR